jgi:hypothetical protein
MNDISPAQSYDYNAQDGFFFIFWNTALRQQVQSFVCVQPWRCVALKFWGMLKNASEVTLVQKIFFS